MANWAYTSYAIEGPIETLKKIEQAILNHPVKEGSDEQWEGNILEALGIKWEDRTVNPKEGLYMRGFINEDTLLYSRDSTLHFSAMEAWGVTDFYKALMQGLPEIKVYWCTEEEGEEIYATNDTEGYHFPERFHVEACIDGEYNIEYFIYQSDMFKWLYDITNGRVNSMEKVEQFNADYENSDACDENYISIHEYKVVEPSPQSPIEAAVPEDSPSGPLSS